VTAVSSPQSFTLTLPPHQPSSSAASPRTPQLINTDLPAKDTPDRAAKIEKHKQDAVQKGGKGDWKPELASDSEQSVAGEKSTLTMEEMQKMGEKKGQKEGGENSK
jgi:hypothetical protein